MLVAVILSTGSDSVGGCSCDDETLPVTVYRLNNLAGLLVDVVSAPLVALDSVQL